MKSIFYLFFVVFLFSCSQPEPPYYKISPYSIWEENLDIHRLNMSKLDTMVYSDIVIYYSEKTSFLIDEIKSFSFLKGNIVLQYYSSKDIQHEYVPSLNTIVINVNRYLHVKDPFPFERILRHEMVHYYWDQLQDPWLEYAYWSEEELLANALENEYWAYRLTTPDHEKDDAFIRLFVKQTHDTFKKRKELHLDKQYYKPLYSKVKMLTLEQKVKEIQKIKTLLYKDK